MITSFDTTQLHRATLLAGSLRQIRHAAERLSAADVIHQLRNSILTAQGALGLVETRLSQGRNDDIDTLLDLAETRLRECRALVARTQSARFGRRQIAALAA